MPDISRRSFVGLAGMLASLPVLTGGLILAPRPARAEDDATVPSQLAGRESEYVIIDVVQPWEVGFMVVDITKGVERDGGLVYYPPVTGAHVKVTSRFNGKTVEGTTNDGGVANLDIRELAVHEAGEDVSKLDSYFFNGTVVVECDGYRKFQTALMVVEGGGGLQVPAHPLNEDKPYPHKVAFDDWDALYRVNEFSVTPANADEHTVTVDVFGLPDTSAATIELWVDGESAPRASAEATPGESAEIGVRTLVDATGKTERVPVHGRPVSATFKALFLKKGDAACLPIGAKLSLVVNQGSTTWKWPLAATTSEGVVDEPAGKEGQQLCPINTQKGGVTALDATWPSGVPIVGGGELKFWSPQLPVNVFVNPFGLVQLTLSIPLWGYRNDQGDESPHGWGRYPRPTVEQQWEKKVKTMKQMADKTNSLVSKPGAIQQIDLFKSFSIDMNLQLLALAQWKSDKGLFQGEVAGQFLAAMNFTITENFFAGPIPVLITFSLDTSFIIALAAAAYAEKKNKNEKMVDAVCDFSRWSFDYTNTGFTMTFNITPSLSVGVGIRGVASISVKGAITLTLFLGVPMGTAPAGLPNPHFAAGWSARISLVLELFLFTKSFTLYDRAFKNFYDNWGDKALTGQAESEGLRALAEKSFDQLLRDLVPITDEMLSKTVEASIPVQAVNAQAVTAQVLSAQAEGEASSSYVDWRALVETGVTQTLADGSTVSYRQEVVEGKDGSSLTLDVFELSGPAPMGGEGERASKDVDATAPVTTAVPMTSDAEELALTAEDDPEAMAVEAPANAADVPLGPQAETGGPAPQAEPGGDVTWLQAQATDELPGLGVASLGAQGGIRPSADRLLFGSEEQHVLSAGHAQVFDIGAPVGKTHEYGIWSFRIAAVEVGGNPRTRVVANCVDGAPIGTSRVIELDTRLEGMPHDDLYDYDFDVMVRQEDMNGRSMCVVCIVILSGRRADGGKTTFVSAATDLVVSHTRISSADFVGKADVLRGNDAGCFSMRASDIANREPTKPHCISSLKITNCPKPNSGEDLSAILFLDRYADSVEGLLGDGATVCVGALQMRRMDDLGDKYTFTVQRYGADWWQEKLGEIDSTVYEADFTPTSHVYDPLYGVPYYLMLLGAEKVHYFRTVLSNYNPTGTWRFMPPVSCGDLDPSIRLVWCPAVEGFLSSYPNDPAQLDLPDDARDYSQWSLHKFTWTNDRNPRMQVAPIGPTGFNVLNFVCRGNFLFWPQTRDADEDRIWTNEHIEDVQAAAAIYQIMACRIRSGHFSDPFVIADLPTDTDMLAVCSVNTVAVMEALRTEYVDTGVRDSEGKVLYHAGNIWYTAVPAVRCVTATACEAPNPFVSPGGKIDFHVAVRNDGNTFLSGCLFELCSLNKDTGEFERVPGASARVTFSQDTTLESTYNRMGPDGKLTRLEPDYALAPGKTSVYAVTVTVPKDWPSGDKKVLFVTSDGTVVQDYAVSAQAEGDSDVEAVEFHVEPGDVAVIQQRTQPDQDVDQRHMETLVVEADVAGGMAFRGAPVTTVDAKSAGADSGSGSNATSTRRNTLPDTGDDTTGGRVGALGAGLAAVGAAIHAYERRRAQNEGRSEGR